MPVILKNGGIMHPLVLCYFRIRNLFLSLILSDEFF
ncbi:hypothetical protein Poras_1393 [Porphyromonas asaccharolytica DSM 20707]|uniref:Uncharacterized protein n=1 Tax=Porphyromonas asaccharolytica (strain ATCC 25260 / DSM 20707 / BCRC 10618 / CCUG 7834 / JCM 6326 / LMG 13178 / VPI 4198 / B440) TaxID=879243 RepID=F4KMM8_PORAD|nr:hypothetical protein Poras_1393 [Porphyromonas asaccharolytica DSM 20707]